MRVLLDCRMAQWSGVGRYTRGLARALAERNDIELLEVVAPGEPVTAGAKGFECPGSPFSASGSRAFGRVVRESAPDVVHCPHFPIPTPAPHPLVVTVHDFIPLVVPGVMPSPVRRLRYRQLLKRAVRAADSLVTLSHFTAESTREFWPPSAERITVIPAAADDFASGPRADLPEVVSAFGQYVFGLGTTRVHKRLDVLLSAWALVEDRLPANVGLVLTGEEPPGFVRQAIGHLKRPSRVVWLGRIDDSMLRALFAGASAFAFPSSHEGFGLPPLEAMALGAPTVCSNAASLPEVVGDAALLVAPGDAAALGDAIVRLVTDRPLAAELRSRGLARAARFTWERAAESTVKVYRDAQRG